MLLAYKLTRAHRLSKNNLRRRIGEKGMKDEWTRTSWVKDRFSASLPLLFSRVRDYECPSSVERTTRSTLNGTTTHSKIRAEVKEGRQRKKNRRERERGADRMGRWKELIWADLITESRPGERERLRRRVSQVSIHAHKRKRKGTEEWDRTTIGRSLFSFFHRIVLPIAYRLQCLSCHAWANQ